MNIIEMTACCRIMRAAKNKVVTRAETGRLDGAGEEEGMQAGDDNGVVLCVAFCASVRSVQVRRRSSNSSSSSSSSRSEQQHRAS